MVRKTTVRAASIAAISAWLALSTGAAVAQNSDAEALFNEAERLEAAGQVPEACDAFEASNRIEPRAGTLVRLGQCREKQGRVVSAWTAYKDALTRVKDPKKKKVAEARVKELEPTLSFLTISVPDESRVDGLVVKRNDVVLDPALWNRAVPVDGGSYTIAGSAPGHEAWQTTVEVATTGDKVAIEVPKFPEIKSLVTTPTGPEPGRKPEQVVPEVPPDDGGSPSMFTGKRKLALGLGVVGLAAIGGGVVLGLQASSLEDDAFALCPDPAVPCSDAAEAQDLSDQAADRALFANIAYGVGGAAIVGAAVLWFTGGPAKPSRVAVAPRLAPGYSGVTVRVGF
jgi:tetratricopeptide (TPR) repeat protein